MLNNIDLHSIVLAFVVVAFTVIAKQAWQRWKRVKELESWIKDVLNERETKVHKVLSFEHDVDESRWLTAEQTRDLVSSKKMKASQNVIHLAKRCRKYACGEKGINAITEEIYDEAFEIAKQMDDRKTTNGNDDVPPLFGVPISVKDRHAVKGTRTAFGMACRLDRIEEEDALVVKLLRSAGAIPICKGNATQMMLLAETVNRVWGRTRNPWNLSRTSGGSSGGDAALVAAGCVPLALASDGTGSIRTPSCFCGVVGFKPTSGRISSKGSLLARKNNKNGKDMILPGSTGPIARCVEDCALFMKAICVPEYFKSDRHVVPMPFDEKTYRGTEKLKIGYFDTDDFFQPCPTGKRAVQETIQALKDAGHDCVPFKIPIDGWTMSNLVLQINAAEGPLDTQMEALEGEPPLPEYTKMWLLSHTPNFIRWIVSKVGDSRTSYIASQTKNGGVSVTEFFEIAADVMEVRNVWADAIAKADVDALVFPGWALPAVEHGTVTDAGLGISYMFIASLLTWPSGVVPVTTVRHDEQHYNMEDLPENQRDMFAKFASKAMKNSVGLPMGISVMTSLFQDEMCLRVMKEIERVVDFKAKPTAYMQTTTTTTASD